MSETAHGYIEILYPDNTYVRDVARILFDAIPDVHAVLAWPWADGPEDNDGLPPPVRKARGFPKDIGGLALSQVSLYVGDKKKDPTNDRIISAREAKKLKAFRPKAAPYTVYLDPDVKCPTWLTQEEVGLAAERYKEHCGHESHDLEAVDAMMREYQRQKIPSLGKKLKTRLVVWFT